MSIAVARAHANIAFIKYWGNADHALRLPVNDSLSMNLHDLYTETTIRWDDALAEDALILNGAEQHAEPLKRVSAHLDHIRARLHIDTRAHIISDNNFPMGAGIASSASAFAALTVAAVAAAGAELTEKELTTLARLGSGSASRSVPAGFVEWYQGDTHETSYAESIAAPDHWDLVDLVAIVSQEHKTTGSSAGHRTADTSDLQQARVAGASRRLKMCKQALLERDFNTFATIVEEDSNLMHAVMMTSRPALFYWKPATLTLMDCIRQLRSDGVPVCYTLDAGPNVHCICMSDAVPQVREAIQTLSGVVDIRESKPGDGATIMSSDA